MTQTILASVLLLVALGYITKRLARMLSSTSKSSCGGCGCASAKKDDDQKQGTL